MNRRRMMGSGGNVSAEFSAGDNLQKLAWLEIEGEKIFESRVFEVRKNKKVGCFINASKYEGFIYRNGELVLNGKGNLSFDFYAKKDFVINAEIKTDFDIMNDKITTYIEFEIEEKEKI